MFARSSFDVFVDIFARHNRTMVRFIPAGLKCRSERAERPLGAAGHRIQRRRSGATPRATARCCSTPPAAWSPSGAPTRSPWTTSPRPQGWARARCSARFGSRAGLMMVLLDEDETGQPAGLPVRSAAAGPGRAATGPAGGLRPRAAALRQHPSRTALGGQPRSAEPLQRPGHGAAHAMSGCCSTAAGTTGDLDAQTDALLALLDADYVHHQARRPRRDAGGPRRRVGELARKLCGR